MCTTWRSTGNALIFAQRYKTVPAEASTAIVISTPASGFTQWVAVLALVA